MKAILCCFSLAFALACAPAPAASPAAANTYKVPEDQPAQKANVSTASPFKNESVHSVFELSTYQVDELACGHFTPVSIKQEFSFQPIKSNPGPDQSPYADDHPSLASRLELGKCVSTVSLTQETYSNHRYQLIAYSPGSYKLVPYLPRILHQRRRSFYPC